jgi:hypothetical protein
MSNTKHIPGQVLTLNTRKNGCHICSRWTAFNGCNHYGPQDFDINKPLIEAIVKTVHNDNGKIIETQDFYAGINAALICLRQNNMLLSKPKKAIAKATGKEVKA